MVGELAPPRAIAWGETNRVVRPAIRRDLSGLFAPRLTDGAAGSAPTGTGSRSASQAGPVSSPWCGTPRRGTPRRGTTRRGTTCCGRSRDGTWGASTSGGSARASGRGVPQSGARSRTATELSSPGLIGTGLRGAGTDSDTRSRGSCWCCTAGREIHASAGRPGASGGTTSNLGSTPHWSTATTRNSSGSSPTEAGIRRA